MSKCMESTKSITKSSKSKIESDAEDPQLIQEHYQNLREEMTRDLPEGHSVQFTLLWEHVVRTKKFPSKVDARSIFHEISERLKDPEWQVRQHALRVLIDILPTLTVKIIDENMQPIIKDLINNLGHSVPAVRKGSLDALRIYLLHTNEKEITLRKIIQTELNRTEELNDFQSDVKMGVILSTPLLLFPSKNSEGPSRDILQEITLTLAARLIDVTYQKAAVRSLTKIREIVGDEEFNSYFETVDDEVKRNFEILSDAYNLFKNKKSVSVESLRKSPPIVTSADALCQTDETTDTSDTTECDEPIIRTIISPSRVVVETEIKFDDNTAITMTILEEQDKENDNLNESDNTSVSAKDEVVKDQLSLDDKRKTPKRVHFGGEEIKLRTPESDESEPFLRVKITPSKIPLPLSPATRMPCYHRTATYLLDFGRLPFKKISTTASNVSKKVEPHLHNSNLSPKKSILSKTNSVSLDITSPKKIQRNVVIHSPKKEPLIKDKVEDRMLTTKSTDTDERFTNNEFSTESFKICSESDDDKKQSVNFHLPKAESESSDSKEEPCLKINNRRGSISPSVLDKNTIESSTNNKGKYSKKARAKSADRKYSKRQSRSLDTEKRGSAKVQNLGNITTRHKSAEKILNNVNVNPRYERNYIMMELTNPPKPYTHDVEDFNRFRQNEKEINFELIPENDNIKDYRHSPKRELTFLQNETQQYNDLINSNSYNSNIKYASDKTKSKPRLQNIRQNRSYPNSSVLKCGNNCLRKVVSEDNFLIEKQDFDTFSDHSSPTI